jgi:hypothetical protein
MSTLQINPFEFMTDINGDPLDAGYIYIGVENLDPETNPISVYYDSAMTIPVSQPIRTVAGFVLNAGLPAVLYVGSAYSTRVRNKNLVQIYYVPSSSVMLVSNPIMTSLSSSGGAALVGSSDYITVQAALDAIKVPSAAVLRTIAPNKAGMVAQMISHVADKAVGGGLFVSVAKGALVDNNGILFSTPSASWMWRRVDPRNPRPEYFGAIGDGVADDTAAVQAALNYATTIQTALVCDLTYKLTAKILGTILFGITSIGSGKFTIAFDDDVFEFSGITQGAIFSNLSFTPTVATATHKAILIFKYQFHCIGLKIDRCQVNGFINCGWNFLKLLKIGGTGGFFGSFCYTNNRTSLIWNDIDLENADWVNSCTFSNNFKFYGNYGVYVPAGSVLYDCNVHGWWGQQTAGIIYALDGGFNKSSIIGMLNWDTNVVALTMGVNSRGNTVAKTYTYDIFDLGYMNKIITDDYTYTSNAATAISTTLFTETAQGNKNAFAALFNTVATTGSAAARNGIVSTFGIGLKQNGYWLRTNAAGGTYTLDSQDPTVLGSDVFGKYDQYSTLRWFLDFSVGSTSMDDKAIKIGFGSSTSNATPNAGTFLTNIGGNFVIATFDAANAATTIYSLGAIKLGRNQVQFISPAYQANLTTQSAIHFNNNFVGRFTLDLNLYKRPIIQIMSTTLQTTLGLLYCDIRTNQSANLA